MHHILLLLALFHQVLLDVIPLEKLLFLATRVCSAVSQLFTERLHEVLLHEYGTPLPLEQFQVRTYLLLLANEVPMKYKVDTIIEFLNHTLHDGNLLVNNPELFLSSYDVNFYSEGGEHFQFVFPVDRLCLFVKDIYVQFKFDASDRGYIMALDCSEGSVAHGYAAHCLQLDLGPIAKRCAAPTPAMSCCRTYVNNAYDGSNSQCLASHHLGKMSQAHLLVNLGMLSLLAAVAFASYKTWPRYRHRVMGHYRKVVPWESV